MKLKLFQLQSFFIGILTIISCGYDDDTIGDGIQQGKDTEFIAISRIVLSKSSAIIAEGDTLHLSCAVSPANATNKIITWSSQDPSIVTVSNEGVVTAIKEGDCEVYAKADSYPWQEKCKLHIINPDIYKAVDLGLPSGTKWGSIDAGYSLAWAETDYKEVYYWGRYKWCSKEIGDYSLIKYCSDDQLKELKDEDDTAYINGAHKWRTPTKDEFQELIDNCIWTYEDLSYYSYYWHKQVPNGRYKVTGKNGNCIFFDFGGEKYSNYTMRSGEIGVYWSRNIADEALVNISTPGDDPYKYACALAVSKVNYKIEAWARFVGIPTRPVRIEDK